MIDITVEHTEGILQPLWSTKLCEKGLWCVSWHPSGQLLAVSPQDVSVQILDADGRTLVRFRTGHKKAIRRLAWDPSGKRLCTCSFDGTASVFAFRLSHSSPSQMDVLLLDSLDGHESEVKSCAFHPTENLIATCGRDKTVWIWEFSSQATEKASKEYLTAGVMEFSADLVKGLAALFTSTHSYEFHLECIAVLEEHNQDVKNVRWSTPTGDLMSCSYDNTVNVWQESMEEWALKETLHGSRGTVWDIAEWPVSDSTIFMVSVGSKGACLLWQSNLGPTTKESHWKSVASLRGLHEDDIFGCDINGTGMLATCSGDNCVSLVRLDALRRAIPDFESQEDLGASRSIPARKVFVHENDVNMVQWCPTDDGLMATCGEDGCLKLWRIPDSF